MRFTTPVLLLFALPALAVGAGHDNNIEWNGVTHIDWLDRRPICPVDGESFDVRFQTYHFDITGARVHVDDGEDTQWVDATFLHRRGPYDVWSATLPATAPDALLTYYIELTDGSDVDYLGPAGMAETPPTETWWIDHLTGCHAPAGATLTSDGGAVFKVWVNAPTWYLEGDWVSVRGDFNGWSCTVLDNLGGGWYCGRAAGVADGDEYKYYFWDETCGGNGWDFHEDARYRYVNRYDNNNSVVVDPFAYDWQVTDFTPPPFEEMIVYELHVGTFSGYNDGLNRMGRYRDIVDGHVDHLRYLGVNVVELMPITEFDGFESWGYNPVTHFAPEESYGNPEDLKYTIDRLHEAGIAVVVDVVYNHFSGNGNYMWEYGDRTYFDMYNGLPACDTPWGAQAAFWRQEVRDYFAENILFWLEEYNVDGFRMDATRFMRGGEGNGGCYSNGADLMKRINDMIDARHVNAISIAEELPNSTWIVDDTPAGAGFDAQWFDPHTDNIRAATLAAARGFDPDMYSVADAIIGWGYEPTEIVRYVESHDEAGGDSDGDEDRRLPVSIDPADPYSFKAKSLTKLAQGLGFVAPGIPMLLQGGEWAEDRKFDAGWDNRIDWSKAVSRAEMTLFFRDLIGLRKSDCALRPDGGSDVYNINDNGNVVVFSRGAGNEIVVIANFSATNYADYALAFPYNGTWHEILNSQATVYGGNGWGNGGSVTVADGYTVMVIPQWSLLVLRYENPAGRSPDFTNDGRVDLHDASILQQQAGWTGCGLGTDVHENGRVDEADLEALAAQMTGP